MGKCKGISTPMVQLKITHKPGNSSVRTIQAKKHYCWWLGALEQFLMKTGGGHPLLALLLVAWSLRTMQRERKNN
jgi:hypothetical protein